MTQGELDQGRRVTALTKLHNGATLNGFPSSFPGSNSGLLLFSMLFGWFIVATSNLAFENSRRRNEERKRKRKAHRVMMKTTPP